MNITEFAQYAGVSKAAVSRYFNGGYLSADKRARIEAAVEATGYHPSIQAQMLRTRRTRQVGVILPKLSSDSCPRIVEGIGSVLEESGYQLLLINTANDPQKELRALDTLCRHTVDGILLIATVYTPEHKAVLERMHVPLVVLGQQYLAKNIGFASGVTLGLATSLGGVMAPLLGWIADHQGLPRAFQFLAAVALLGAVFAYTLKPVAKKEQTA